MYGAVFCMYEEFIIETYNIDIWHQIKNDAEATAAAATAAVAAVDEESTDSTINNEAFHHNQLEGSINEERIVFQTPNICTTRTEVALEEKEREEVIVKRNLCQSNNDNIEGTTITGKNTKFFNQNEFSIMIYPNDYQFLRRKYYPDEWCIQLVVHTSSIVSIPVPVLLKHFGVYTIQYHYKNEHSNLLHSLGTTLRDWLSNLNAMHNYLQKTFTGTEFKVSCSVRSFQSFYFQFFLFLFRMLSIFYGREFSFLLIKIHDLKWNQFDCFFVSIYMM